MRRSGSALLCLVLAAALTGGCGANASPAEHPVPVRVETAGQELLAAAPMGADLILEVDLERLRANPVVGSLLASVAAPESSSTVDLLQLADVALLCVYDIGGVPKQLVILRAKGGDLAGAARLGDGLYAVGDAALLARAEGLQGREKSMAADQDLLRSRAEVMPAKAQAATLRMAARLDFDARVAIASKIAISDVPVSVAVWGDVVDDLALVADLGTDEEADIPRLERAIAGLKKSLAKNAFARYLGLTASLRDARVTRGVRSVQVVLLLSPKRLQLVVRRLLQHLANPKQ